MGWHGPGPWMAWCTDPKNERTRFNYLEWLGLQPFGSSLGAGFSPGVSGWGRENEWAGKDIFYGLISP